MRCAPSKVKGKVVGLWSHLPVRSAQGVCHRQTAPYNPPAFFRESWAKNFTRLRRARALVVRTDAAFSRRPLARIAWGATPAHVRYPLDEHERSELS